MGTHGITWIKKDDKKIEITDSYDGYFSAMGLNNVLSIKYMSDEVMNKLVDAFIPLDYSFNGEDDDVEISERQIQNALYQMEKDLEGNQAGLDWAKAAMENDIRGSTVGFGPILYLNVNPSWNGGNDYADYMIDLDKKEFISVGHTPEFKLSFDTIRKTPESVLRYFGESVGEQNLDLVKNSKFKELADKHYELHSKTYSNDLSEQEQEELRNIVLEVQKEVDKFFSASPEDMKSYEEKKQKEMQKMEEEHKKYLEELEKKMALQKQFYANGNLSPSSSSKNKRRQRGEVNVNKEEEEANYWKMVEETVEAQGGIKNNELIDDSDEVGSFSIFSAEVNMSQLRKIISYTQKYIKVNPQAKFLQDCVEWWANENGSGGGFRFFSPKKASQQELFRNFQFTVENEFKIRMRIMTSTGTYGNGSNSNSIFGDIEAPRKSLMALEELKNSHESWIDGIDGADPTMAFYVNYDEARNVVLSNSLEHENYSVMWTYFALINQDTEVLNKISEQAKSVFEKQEDNVKKAVSEFILNSIVDGEQINNLLGLESNMEFHQALKQSWILDKVKPFMNKCELNIYFPEERKKLKT